MFDQKRNNGDRKGKRGKGEMPLLRGPRQGFFGNLGLAFLVLFLLVGAYSLVQDSNSNVITISLSELARDIGDSKVKKITIKGDNLLVDYGDDVTKESKKEVDASLTDTLSNYGVAPDKLSAVSIEVKGPSGFTFWLVQLAPFVLPIIFIFLFIWFLSRQVRGAGMQAFTFGQSKARIISPHDKKQKVTFKDVAGVKEAKEELSEIVDFLRNPKKFLEIGARIPKGVLLMGASGTGKTLLARAVAGEAGVAFFSISGSEFVEMFVGVGASVTGDTPVLVRHAGGTKLMPIGELVDSYCAADESDIVKPVTDVETLGYRSLQPGFRGEKCGGKQFFGGSVWSAVKGVYRHKVDKVFRIRYRGGEFRATGDHSVFVRSRNMIVEKRISELKPGEILVNLPFKVRNVFVPGLGTTHKVRAHEFVQEVSDLYYDLYDGRSQTVQEEYEYALTNRGVLAQSAIGEHVGVSQSTVMNWQLGHHIPRFLANNLHSAGTPKRLQVTDSLMRLLGYYAAEGRTTEYYTQFVFGLHKKELHADCISLIRQIFLLEPHVAEVSESNSIRITISSPVIARFFESKIGNGSFNKHMPAILWELPYKYFEAFLEGYSRGDGYTTKDGKLSVCSVSHQIILEFAWLCSMHGIQVGVRETVAPAGRVIRKGGKTLPETRAWNLIIGKTSHPFREKMASPNQFKRPIVQEITEESYDGYVYDLCGCEGEAFFGGEKPILLHNSRVRDLFKLAKQAAPAIVFIDEIDAVGRVRGTGVGGGNDEREQTLNQILVEMDGFEPNEKLVIMAATNRPDVLDPALVRPGRFDRRVVIDLPDRADREAILAIHSKEKPFAEDVSLQVIAERTPGFSGADLYSLMNEGAILAARENRKKVSQYDLIRAIEKVMLGPERKSHLLSKKEKAITAYHEAGHALVASVLPFADPVHKISIIARGHAGGYTLKLPMEERKLQSKQEFLDDIAVSLGGYVAERMIFGDITTGPSSDLQIATAMARDMVTKYGMSEKLGPVALESLGGKLLMPRGFTDHEYSEEIGAMIDAEVNRIMNDGLARAGEILSTKKAALEAIALRLIEVETIERDEFEKLLIANGITPKRKQDIEHQV